VTLRSQGKRIRSSDADARSDWAGRADADDRGTVSRNVGVSGSMTLRESAVYLAGYIAGFAAAEDRNPHKIPRTGMAASTASTKD